MRRHSNVGTSAIATIVDTTRSGRSGRNSPSARQPGTSSTDEHPVAPDTARWIGCPWFGPQRPDELSHALHGTDGAAAADRPKGRDRPRSGGAAIRPIRRCAGGACSARCRQRRRARTRSRPTEGAPTVTRHLYRLGLASARHPWRTIGAWLACAFVIVLASMTVGRGLEDTSEVPGLDSQRAVDLLSAAQVRRRRGHGPGGGDPDRPDGHVRHVGRRRRPAARAAAGAGGAARRGGHGGADHVGRRSGGTRARPVPPAGRARGRRPRPVEVGGGAARRRRAPRRSRRRPVLLLRGTGHRHRRGDRSARGGGDPAGRVRLGGRDGPADRARRCSVSDSASARWRSSPT